MRSPTIITRKLVCLCICTFTTYMYMCMYMSTCRSPKTTVIYMYNYTTIIYNVHVCKQHFHFMSIYMYIPFGGDS